MNYSSTFAAHQMVLRMASVSLSIALLCCQFWSGNNLVAKGHQRKDCHRKQTISMHPDTNWREHATTSPQGYR